VSEWIEKKTQAYAAYSFAHNHAHFQYHSVPKFLVQFGISYTKDKELQRFAKTPLPDDPNLGKTFHPGKFFIDANLSSQRRMLARRNAESVANYEYIVQE
jgi:hypothetical protein